MPKLRFQISISLDGFVAGPEQSTENPLGLGGFDLHQWVVPVAAWGAPHGLEGGEVNVDEMELHLVPILLGAGERLFDGVPSLEGLRLVRTIAAPGVTHLKFERP